MGLGYRRIGVLTSGGDAPGMNAAIRAVTYAAKKQGVEVMGIYEGYAGLMAREMKLLRTFEVEDIASHGGTMLYSARCDAFLQEEGRKEALRACRENGIDALAVIGGDGTFRGAADLCALGLPCVGIPASIDNDVTASEDTVGFDTAVNTAIGLMDRLRDTSESHARCNIIEVMGRSCGQIALCAGIGAGAVGIAIAELPFCRAALLRRIRQSRAKGQREFLVVVAEGIRKQTPDFTEALSHSIQQETGIETRTTVLGHVVRGGAPSAHDRLLASEMGAYAVSLLLHGESGKGVGIQNGRLYAFPLSEIGTWEQAYRHLLSLSLSQWETAQVPPLVLARAQSLYARYLLSDTLQPPNELP